MVILNIGVFQLGPLWHCWFNQIESISMVCAPVCVCVCVCAANFIWLEIWLETIENSMWPLCGTLSQCTHSTYGFAKNRLFSTFNQIGSHFGWFAKSLVNFLCIHLWDQKSTLLWILPFFSSSNVCVCIPLSSTSFCYLRSTNKPSEFDKHKLIACHFCHGIHCRSSLSIWSLFRM